MVHNKTDPAEAEDLWIGTPEMIAAEVRARMEIGFRTLIPELPAPFDQETIERLIGDVRPLLD